MKTCSKITFLEKKKEISKTGGTPVVIKEVILDDFDPADTYNKFFVNILLNLKKSPEKTFEIIVDDIDDPVFNPLDTEVFANLM